ncbi:uncharacterized protein TNCV_1535411 [Trichonephila clavipes]|uniref:Transposable element Tc3 transposase n=1 Tax=Trichonephila clavipes TaxID=2585209 RepID=A0A8X6V1N4_TRICX|nr:uncharacterized protein TNCV_1535411 [Trichonephila clavipes]
MTVGYIFQKDGAPCHYHNKITPYFSAEVPVWIDHGGCVEWSARHPDLLPVDFSLKAFVKYQVNTSSFSLPIPELKSSICTANTLIDRNILTNLSEELIHQWDIYRVSNFLPGLLYKRKNECSIEYTYLTECLPNTPDEAHFWLNGYVNKQNCRIWSEANPQVYVETPLHPEKLTVWSALWAGGIIGPYFFKNDEGHNVTVNGDLYRAMITNFFIPELNNHDVQELWFQQDGATCHTARATIDLLKDTFGDSLISRFGSLNWSARSCDLTPLDYFLWGYAKSLVYTDKAQTLDHLEDNIRRVIADIRPQMLEKSSKIRRPDWTTSETAVAVLFQKSFLKCNAISLSFE